MVESYRDELKRIFRALEIHGPRSFTLGGCTFAVDAQADNPPGNSPLVKQLTEVLYAHCYCRRFTDRLEEKQLVLDAPGASPEALSEANTSRVRWESGWTIEALLPSGEVIAGKQARRRLFRAGEYLTPHEAGVTPRPGASLLLYRPRESWTLQPGFYYAFGETLAELTGEHGLIRYYWNLRPSGTAQLVRLITQRLNQYQIPFSLKCLLGTTDPGRRDSAVVFTQRRFHRLLVELFKEVGDQLRDHVESDTPLFTLALAPGLALAEDPATGESFGIASCRLLARALEDAYLHGAQGEAERLDAVARRFRQIGTTLERPYATSAWIYDAVRGSEAPCPV